MLIRGQELYALILSGAKNVVVNENGLNKINVFPVPDGDTGTNLSLTMNRIIESSKQLDSVSDQLDEMAEIAIDNAYGNSGMIFAQYINGLSNSLKGQTQIHISDFLKSFKSAYQHAFDSVTHPKEGTILSVMKEWANNFEGDFIDNFEHVFESNLDKLKKSVENTKYQLKVLKDNNVVDAGAMAFFYFMEGMLNYLKHGKMEDITFIASTLEWINEPLNTVDIGSFRYCCQFLIKGQIDPNRLKNELDRLGDSLIINQKGENTNIHMHTNHPDQIMKLLLSKSSVISHKVDDMFIQSQMIHHPISKIALLTDSIADVPQSIIDQEQIVVLPLNIIIDSTVFMDKLTMTSSNFYQHMDEFKLSPSSSQPTQKHIERLLNQVLNHYDEVIGIFVSSKMSGTYANILKTLSKMDLKSKKVKIIDAKTNSVAQGLIVLEAIKARQQGLDFEEIVKRIDSSIERTRIFVSVKDLKYMIKGGRVSKLSGFILSKLKLQPVISIDPNGQGIIPYKSLSQKSALKSILKQIKKDKNEHGIEEYALVYADNVHDLDDFKDKCQMHIGQEAAFIESISPIVGLNAGKGAIAIAYMTKARLSS